MWLEIQKNMPKEDLENSTDSSENSKNSTRQSEDQIEESEISFLHQEICPDCHGKIRNTSKETYCTHCGLVIDDDLIDFGIDWTGEEGDEVGSEIARAGKPGSYADGDKFNTGMTEIAKVDCIKLDKGKKKE